MKPKPRPRDAFELFQAHFDQILNPGHELVQLAQRVNVDTTVQEKNITFPTDFKLLYKAIVKLVQAAKARGLRSRPAGRPRRGLRIQPPDDRVTG